MAHLSKAKNFKSSDMRFGQSNTAPSDMFTPKTTKKGKYDNYPY